MVMRLPKDAVPIPGFEGRYSITPKGDVWSVARVGRGQVGINSAAPHRLQPALGSTGYDFVTLRKDGKGYPRGIHSLVAETFLGLVRGRGDVVRHYDGDKTNNEVGNLRVGTQRENLLDTVRHGRHAYAKRDHCKRGHIFTESNTKYRPDRTGRICTDCIEVHRQMTVHKRAIVNKKARMIYLAQQVCPGGKK